MSMLVESRTIKKYPFIEAKGIGKDGWNYGMVTTWGKMIVLTDGQNLLPFCDETLCFFTGITDKNGRKIYSGDICRINEEEKDTFIVEWMLDEARFSLISDNTIYDFDNLMDDSIEVIGSVYDDYIEGGKELD